MAGAHVFTRSWQVRAPSAWRLRLARLFFRLTVRFGSPREGDVTFLSDGLNSLQYNVTEVTYDKLYTNITVDLLEVDSKKVLARETSERLLWKFETCSCARRRLGCYTAIVAVILFLY